MNRKEKAVELKHHGYNCAQAVLCTFAEDVGMESAELKKIGAAYGGGMGCMEATCGALCGAQMLLGLKEYGDKPILKDAASTLRVFHEKCGATICRDLKGMDTGVVLCECDDCVRNAVEIVEGIL